MKLIAAPHKLDSISLDPYSPLKTQVLGHLSTIPGLLQCGWEAETIGWKLVGQLAKSTHGSSGQHCLNKVEGKNWG